MFALMQFLCYGPYQELQVSILIYFRILECVPQLKSYVLVHLGLYETLSHEHLTALESKYLQLLLLYPVSLHVNKVEILNKNPIHFEPQF